MGGRRDGGLKWETKVEIRREEANKEKKNESEHAGRKFCCCISLPHLPIISWSLSISVHQPFSIHLTTHLPIYPSIHLPALITLHRLLFSFTTTSPLPIPAAFHQTSRSIIRCSSHSFFDSSHPFSQISSLYETSELRRLAAHLLFHFTLQTLGPVGELCEVLCFLCFTKDSFRQLG